MNACADVGAKTVQLYTEPAVFSVLGQTAQQHDLMGRNLLWFVAGRDLTCRGDKARQHGRVKVRTATNKVVKRHRGFL